MQKHTHTRTPHALPAHFLHYSPPHSHPLPRSREKSHLIFNMQRSSGDAQREQSSDIGTPAARPASVCVLAACDVCSCLLPGFATRVASLTSLLALSPHSRLPLSSRGRRASVAAAAQTGNSLFLVGTGLFFFFGSLRRCKAVRQQRPPTV